MSTRPQLTDSPASELELLRRRIEELEDELQIERLKVEEMRQKSVASGRAQARLRSLLQPWNQLFKEIFGELDAAGVEAEEAFASPSQPVSEAAYSAWKSRLPTSCGRIIDALLIQPLSQTQMATICKMHYNTVKNAMVILRKNALVEQDGNLYKLKRL